MWVVRDCTIGTSKPKVAKTPPTPVVKSGKEKAHLNTEGKGEGLRAVCVNAKAIVPEMRRLYAPP